MRVTNKSLHDSILIQLNAASSEMVAANQIISSGKKINRPSDDPVGLVSVMHLKSSLANLDQLERNLSTGKSWLEAGESALSETENILSGSQRRNMGQNLSGQIKKVHDLGNASARNAHISGYFGHVEGVVGIKHCAPSQGGKDRIL